MPATTSRPVVAEADIATAAAPVDRSHPAAAVPLAAGVLAALAVLGWAARRGLDRTDEGYYLLSIARPRDVTADLLSFGHVYHPLSVLLSGNVTALRWAGILLTVLTGGLLAWTVLGTPGLVGAGRRWPAPLRAATSVALGCSGLLTVVAVPLTPSYNTLAFQGLALTCTGLVAGLTRDGRWGRLGWAAVGAGGWLTLLAKPTSAALLAVAVVAAVAVVPRRWSPAMAVAPLATLAAAGLTLAGYRQSPMAFADRLVLGLEASRSLGGHDDVVRLDTLLLREDVLAGLLGVAGAAALALALVRRSRSGGGALAAVATSGLLALGAGALALVLAGRVSLAPLGAMVPAVLTTTGVLTGAALLAVAAVALARAALRRGRPVGQAPSERATAIALTAVLLLMPLAYAFGTNGNLWAAAGRAVVFWLVLLTARLAGTPGSVRAVPALTSLVALVALLLGTVDTPYRYPSLRSATVAAPVGPSGTLLLTPGDAAQVRATRALADRAGLDDDARVLDLTGASPGTVYLLRARPVGQAWLIGGYSGSEETARLVLRHERCAVAGAFVLTDSSSRRGIDPSVLAEAGLDLGRDFHEAGRLTYYRAAFGGAPPAPAAEAVLHAPARPGALPAGCD